MSFTEYSRKNFSFHEYSGLNIVNHLLINLILTTPGIHSISFISPERGLIIIAATIKTSPDKEIIEGPLEKSKRYENPSPPIETKTPKTKAIKNLFLQSRANMAEKVAGIIR